MDYAYITHKDTKEQVYLTNVSLGKQSHIGVTSYYIYSNLYMEESVGSTIDALTRFAKSKAPVEIMTSEENKLLYGYATSFSKARQTDKIDVPRVMISANVYEVHDPDKHPSVSDGFIADKAVGWVYRRIIIKGDEAIAMARAEHMEKAKCRQ